MNKFQFILDDFKKNQKIDYLTWVDSIKNSYKEDKDILDILDSWEPKIGIYPGSFNPFHKGHYNILQKAEKIFDRVIIAKGINPDKRNDLFDFKVDLIEDRQIIIYDGLLTDMLCNLGYEVTVVRGLRNATDLQYESTQYQFLKDMMPDIKVINIFCDKEYEHISSSAIRNLMNYGDVYKNYII